MSDEQEMSEEEMLAAGLLGFEKDETDPAGGFYYPIKGHPAVDAWFRKTQIRKVVPHG